MRAETIAPNGGKAEVARIGEDSKSTIAVNARDAPALSGLRKSRYWARIAACISTPSETVARQRAGCAVPSAPAMRQTPAILSPLLFAAPGAGVRAAVHAVVTGLLATIATAAPRVAEFSGAPPIGTQARSENDGLSAEPLDAEGLGFRMRVPIGTGVRIEKSPTLSFLLSEGTDSPAWRLRAAAVTASKAGTTAKSQCDDYLADLRKREQKFDVLVDEPRAIAGRTAHIVYLGVPLEGGGRGITGTLVVPSDTDSYIAFSIVVSDARFAGSRALLDKAFATIEFKDRTKALLENTDLLARGAEIMVGIRPETLRGAADDKPRAYRMWRPDENGAKKDFGYMIVRAREGRQGEVDASKDPKAFEGQDAEPGLFASIDARVVVGDDPTHTVDAQSRYFVRWDRASEAWSLRTTERHKRATRSSAQTGLRLAPTTGSPRPTLKVINASRDGMTRDPLDYAIPPVYFSQAELIVLGDLLPRDATMPAIEFKDYAFDQRDLKLPLRRETWTRIDHGWRLETQLGSAPAKIVQEFDGAGKRTRRVDVDGSVTELIDLEDLRTLWKAKGLPVD